MESSLPTPATQPVAPQPGARLGFCQVLAKHHDAMRLAASTGPGPQPQAANGPPVRLIRTASALQ